MKNSYSGGFKSPAIKYSLSRKLSFHALQQVSIFISDIHPILAFHHLFYEYFDKNADGQF